MEKQPQSCTLIYNPAFLRILGVLFSTVFQDSVISKNAMHFCAEKLKKVHEALH